MKLQEIYRIREDVEFIKKGDIVSVPFNVACGRCQNCKNSLTGICLNVNGDRGGAWICGYGWLDRRSSRIRDGALCRFQPIEIPDKSKPWKDIRSNYAD
jgi:glutathione-independent formaldehyde dehydrogenase